MKKIMKALPVHLLLSLVLVAQLALFAPSATAASAHPTSQCTGTVTLTGRLGTITRAISFILIGTYSGPFGFTYSAIINGFTYSAVASGNCTPR
jgi:hypothetical protein